MRKLLPLVVLFFLYISTLKAQEGTKITQTTLVEIKVNSVLHISCHGDKKGAINIMVSGGVPPYKYKWSNGAVTQDIAGLAAGVYSVTVTDSYDCPDSLTVEIKQPEKLELAIESVKDILCYGFGKGEIDVSVKGGVPPYVYSWSNGSTSQDLKNAIAGEHALLVTDANHCQEIISATIEQNQLIIRSDEKVQNVDCAGDSSGFIDIEVKGGVPPYKYSWTSGEKTEDIKDKPAGTYTVQVIDSQGCLETYSTNIFQPNPIQLTLEEVRHINCAGDKSGAIDVIVKGGVKPYKYRWNDSLAFTKDLAGLPSGNYTLVVEDDRNCSKSLTQEVNEPEKLDVIIEEVKNVMNFGGTDGAVYIDVKGGVKPYKYEWSNGTTSQDVANIPANSYSCRITDANKCVSNISVNIEQPDLLEVKITHAENIKCYGQNTGYIDVEIKGGVSPYAYAWSNGDTIEDIKNLVAGTYNLTVTDAHQMIKTVKATIEQPTKLSSNIQSISNNLCYGNNAGTIDINVKGGTPPYKYNWNNGNRKQDITNASAGDYKVEIMDKNLCTDSLSATIEQPSQLNVEIQNTVDISCFGNAEGSVNINVTGGTTPYSFNWSNGANTKNLTNIPAGKYKLKVSDANGCDQFQDVVITEPSILQSSIAEVIDVKCKGDSTGSINIKIEGGTSPYAYTWNNGKATKDNTGIGAGSYNVKIVDAKGCSNTLSATVIEPSKLTTSLVKTINIDCYGDETGSIDVAVGGGVQPYVYNWSNGASTQNLIGVKAGEYSLTVKDQNGCTSQLETVIEQNSLLEVDAEEITHVLCNSMETGAAKINVKGGVEPYTYRWNNGNTGKDLSNVKAGNYTLNISDSKACVAKLDVVINEPDPFEGKITEIVQIGCHGDSNGAITTEFKGGVTPYAYKWNTEATTPSIQNLVAGTYTLLATDKNACEKTLEAVIEQPTKLELELLSTTNNPCYGERNGAVDIAVKGGVTPYTYEWSNGATTQDLTGIEAGKYLLNVTGATGCEKSLEVEITQPEPLELVVSSTTNVSCFGGNNGALDVAVTGGVEPYIYSWSNGATSQDIEGIVAGSYTINVTDANGCYNSISAMVSQPEPLVAVLEDVKNINCHGDSTGAISISVTGGSQPYTYKWSNGAQTEDVSNLKVGDYSVEIIDANGCNQKLEATITQPELLIAEIKNIENVLCNGVKEGSIDISVKGGVTPYTYSWNNGFNEQDISNVGAGKYSVQIQDANGCNRNLDAEITEPSMLVVSIAEIVNIKEYGNKNGSLSITVNGGTSPYTYSWSNGETTQNIEKLVAGNYSVIVLDANNCRQDVNAEIIQPDAIELVLDTISHIRCYGEQTGFAKVTAKGGVPPYKYKWNNGDIGEGIADVSSGEYILKVTDANNASKEKKIIIEQPEYFKLEIEEIIHPTCYELNNGMIITDVKGGTTPYIFAWGNGSDAQNLKGLTSGKYAITVTDARGCIQSDSTELFKPDPLEVTLMDTEHIKCNGENKGKVDINVMGGTPPYQYNWSHGAKEQDLNNVRAGNYTLKVIDANSCTQTINAVVEEPPALVADFAEIRNVYCQGDNTGFINTSVTGGVSPYNYIWSNGDSTANISSLSKGKYSVQIVDANRCSNNLSTEITEPEKLTGQVENVNDINCFGANEGSIVISVNGGTPPYTYGWNNGSNDQNLTGIPEGDYSVKITDNLGCSIYMNAKVEQPTQLVATIEELQHIKCFGDETGSINVSVNGGVQPYQYSWSNGQNTQDLVNIPAGNYTLNVKDSKGCLTTLTTDIMEPEPLVVKNTSINNIKCSGDTEGEVTISVTGGVTPYTYEWSNGAATRDIQNVPAGTYNILVTDANGCSKPSFAEVTEPPLLVNSVDAITHINCHGESTGSVNISVSGGISPYSYQWSNGLTTQDLLNIPAGKYSVLIKEGNGCESELNVEINEPTPFISEILNVEHNNCFGDKNGKIEISAEGGTTPYSFIWNNGSKTQNLENIVAGDYSVLVSDANGCNHTLKAEINEPPKLVLKIDSARNVKCCGDTSGAIFITVNGGVQPYSYLWSNGETSQDITGLVEGQYTVSVTDGNGCEVNTPEEGATIYEKIIAQGKFVSRDILFDVGKATIKENSFIEISRIASFMKEHPLIRFSIEGHTDSQGNEQTNQDLSERRAEAIKESLVKFGISESRLETKGWGESKPIDTNATPQGRANNRRVEFIPL